MYAPQIGCKWGEMRRFSDWISSHSLVDLQMGGALITWSNHQSNHAMSRLDRFLVSTEWLETYPEVTHIALPKPVSDHCPILLDLECERWGPSSFCFELMWLEEEQFPKLVQEWWEDSRVEGWASHSSLGVYPPFFQLILLRSNCVLLERVGLFLCRALVCWFQGSFWFSCFAVFCFQYLSLVLFVLFNESYHTKKKKEQKKKCRTNCYLQSCFQTTNCSHFIYLSIQNVFY